MKQLNYLAILLVFGILFYSCDPCSHLDCISSNFYGQFRITRVTDGQDLVFGPGKIYDKDQITFFSVKNADTIFHDYQTVSFPGTGYDSILNVGFFTEPEIAYIRLSNGDIDTLKISYNTYDTKCCGRITEITNFRFNNLLDIPGSAGTQEIRK